MFCIAVTVAMTDVCKASGALPYMFFKFYFNLLLSPLVG